MATPAKLDTPTKLYLGMRAIRWAIWIGFLLYGLHYAIAPQSHLDQFNHLLPTTELMVFGLGLAAVFTGMFELALRGRAGLAQPEFAQLVPPKASGPTAQVR